MTAIAGWLLLVRLLGAPIATGHDAVVGGNPLARYQLKTWTREHGLPSDNVRDVEVARDGYVWAATKDGLVRFSGNRFTIWDQGSTPALLGSDLSSLHEDADETLWFGSDTPDGLMYRTKAGEIFRLPSTELVQVRGVYGQRDGAVLALSAYGLVAIRGRETRLIAAPPPGHDLRAWAELGPGDVWVGGHRGVLRAVGGRFVPVDEPGQPSMGLVRTLLAEPDGTLWIGTDQNGLVRRARGGGWTRWSRQEGLPSDTIHALMRDRSGSLWMGTGSGVARLVQDRIEARPDAPGWTHAVRALAEDARGAIWLALADAGLGALTEQPFHLVAHASMPEARPAQVDDWRIAAVTDVRAVIRSADGVVWVASGRDGLVRVAGPRIAGYRVVDGMPSQALLGIADDGRGRIWFATSRGVCLVEKRQLQVAADTPGAKLTPRCFGARENILIDADSPRPPLVGPDPGGLIHVRTRAGVALFDPARTSSDLALPHPALASVSVRERPLLAGGTVDPSSPVEVCFEALQLSTAPGLRLVYRLDGRDADWHTSDGPTCVSYQGLRAGDHLFRVRTATTQIDAGRLGPEVTFAFTVARGLPRPLLGAAIALAAIAGAAVLWWRTRRRRAGAAGTHDGRVGPTH